MKDLTGRTVFWSASASDLLRKLDSDPEGLSSQAASSRLEKVGQNRLKSGKRTGPLRSFLAQLESPIILILLSAAGISLFLRDATDASIILAIILLSAVLGFWQERGAANAVEKLLAVVRTNGTVLRDRQPTEIPLDQIVPGDVVILSAGAVVPGDCFLLESKDLFVDEAALTGETYPVEKTPGVIPAEIPISGRTNSLFLGSHVVSGSARAVVALVGRDTEFGKVSERLKLRPPETAFEHGIRRFGFLLMEVTLVLVLAIFATNVYFHRHVLDSFLFALALAVGLTPQLLPAIITVNLSHGAKRMAASKVIVKRLNSIEDFGSMNVLCTDKTGTLTEGVVTLNQACDPKGQESKKVLQYAYLNAFFETGFLNPVDEAIRRHHVFDVSGFRKLDEVPYDFLRKRLSILVEREGRRSLITKGALASVLVVCDRAESSSGEVEEIGAVLAQIQQLADGYGEHGFRTLGVAYRDTDARAGISKEHETGMIFLGFLVFHDPPKEGVVETLAQMKRLGVAVKVITGDSPKVANHLGREVGLHEPRCRTGQDLRQMSDEALITCVNEVDIFAEIEPNQKERIILALKKAGNVVGYLGDGINDASALHAADVGISVDSAVDVAKEAADIVLMEKALRVLLDGIQEGRRTFANTMKYVFMATSANFGNMFSMAGASLFLPFLPLLPKQILLTNLLTDFPEMTIATDRVDPEMVEVPRRWDVRFVRRFMLTFGLLSSVFDYLTFGVLLLLLKATESQFRTGWFIESVVSASLIVLAIRTRRPLVKSMPGKKLFLATLAIVFCTLILPWSWVGGIFGFTPLPPVFLILMFAIVALYLIGVEVTKKVFFKRMDS